MIDKINIIDTVTRRLAELPDGHALDLRTYKRNRSVTLVRLDADRIRVIQDGYGREDFVIETRQLRRTMKKLLRKEFPRSTKIRLYNLGEYSSDTANLNRKTI